MAFIYISTSSSGTITVPYTIMWDNGIIESNPEDGPAAIVKFKCLWSDHYTLVQQLLGLVSGAPPHNVTPTAPFAYPPSPNLWCTSVDSIEPLGRPYIIPNNYLGQTLGLPWITRKRAIVTARFTRPPYLPTATGPYWSLSFAGAGEFLTLPETTYRFGDGTPTNTPIGFIIPQAEITVTRFRMPFIPDQVIASLLGSINAYPFQIGYNIYPKGSLMFMVGATNLLVDVFGNITYTVEYKFMYRPVDWNKYFHPDRTTGFATVTDGNGNPPFAYLDYEVLP